MHNLKLYESDIIDILYRYNHSIIQTTFKEYLKSDEEPVLIFLRHLLWIIFGHVL